MTKSNYTHEGHIDQSYRMNTRIMEWGKLRIQILGIMVLLVLGGVGYWYYNYGFLQTTDTVFMVLGAGAILFIMLICLLCNTANIITQSGRNCAEDLLRFDLYQSSKESFGGVLEEAAQHFDSGRRKIDSLADLVAEAKKVSARYIHFKSMLDNMHGDMETADKLRELIQLQLSEHSIQADTGTVVAFIDRNKQ